MKQYLLLFIFALWVSAMTAQDLTFEFVESETKEFILDEDNMNQDVVLKGVLNNNTDQAITVTWIREEIYLSSNGWKTAICDDNRCYLPFVSTESVEVEPQGSTVMDAHLYPSTETGDSAVVVLRMVGDVNPNDTISATYRFFEKQPVSSQRQHRRDAVQVAVFPNPAVDFVRIQANAELGRIEVFDILGKRIQDVEVRGNEAILNVSSMSKGVYVIRIKSDEGAVLKTQRLRIQG